MSAGHYDKILLTKKDLAHVYKQFVSAQHAKIQEHLPGSDNHDPLRVQVENLVNEHLAAVFEMAKHALVVDGADMEGSDVPISELLLLKPTEEVYPFDAQLNQQLRETIETVERQTTEVTRLRRELPQQARDAYEQLVSSVDGEVTALVKELNEDADEVVETEQIPNDRHIREELLKSIYDLNAVKRELPRHVEQVSSLSSAIDFLTEHYEKQKLERRVF